MNGFLIRMLACAAGLWLASAWVPGFSIGGPGTLLLAALLLGVVNAVVRPLVVLLTLPITILSLGLFLLVINATMIGLVAWLLPGFRIDGFWAAFVGWVLVSLIGWFVSWTIGPKGRYQVLVSRREHRD